MASERWFEQLNPAGRCGSGVRPPGRRSQSGKPRAAGAPPPGRRRRRGSAGRGAVPSRPRPSCVTTRGPPLAAPPCRRTGRGAGAWPRPCGQGLSRPRLPRLPGSPGVVVGRGGRGRGRGLAVSATGAGRDHKRPRPFRHGTGPRPSRRLPGGRQGAGVCAGADSGTVGGGGGGGGLGQCRVGAARGGGDCGRRGRTGPAAAGGRGWVGG